MKKTMMVSLCALILVTTTFASSLETVVKTATDYMKAEGYVTEKVHEDGDFKFKKEGLTYRISFDSKEPLYVSIQLSFVTGYSGEKLVRAQIAANETMRKIKGVKVLLDSDNDVLLTADFFMVSADNFGPLFSRYITTLPAARKRFFDQIDK